MRFPFFDRYGQIVLWDRRQRSGRRKVDETTRWSKKDLPGFILMTVMFVVLSLGVLYLWINKPTLSTQGIVNGQAIYAQSVTSPSIGLRAIKSLLGR
jgi:polyferredoxin